MFFQSYKFLSSKMIDFFLLITRSRSLTIDQFLLIEYKIVVILLLTLTRPQSFSVRELKGEAWSRGRPAR